MVREGELLETDTLSELGIFGAFLRRGDKVLLNKESGHLIRTKVQTLHSISKLMKVYCKCAAPPVTGVGWIS